MPLVIDTTIKSDKNIFYVGDPVYVMDSSLYHSWKEDTNKSSDKFEHNGKTYVIYHQASADRSLDMQIKGQQDKNYPNESGFVAILPIEFVKEKYQEKLDELAVYGAVLFTSGEIEVEIDVDEYFPNDSSNGYDEIEDLDVEPDEFEEDMRTDVLFAIEVPNPYSCEKDKKKFVYNSITIETFDY